MIGTRRLLVRRLALALAAAQLAAFALVPVIEASEQAGGPPGIEAAHGSCERVHQPATCLACVLLTARARAPERPGLAFAMVESRASDAPAVTVTPARAPPRALRTRAPPTLAA